VVGLYRIWRLSIIHINFTFLFKKGNYTVLQSHFEAHKLTGGQVGPGRGATTKHLMEAIQSTSRPTADEAFPGTHLMACDLHCSGATAAWCAMVIMLRGVTSHAAMACSLEIWCPVYGHAAQREWGIHYSTVVKTTAGHPWTVGSTNRGSLTRYMHDGAFDGTFKALCIS